MLRQSDQADVCFQIHCLTGHDNTVVSLKTQANDPQIISGSMDSTIRLWDLVSVGRFVRSVVIASA